MYSFRLLLQLTFLVFLFSCSNDDGPDIPITYVRTEKFEMLENGGVRFFGSISDEKSLTEHGFMYTDDSTVWISPDRKINLGVPKEQGEFSSELLFGIDDKKMYYFRAFVEGSIGKHHGNIVSFFSNGSIPPEIYRIEPERVRLNEQIKIYGKNLGNEKAFSTVTLDQIEVYKDIAPDSVISVVIPYELSESEFLIKVSLYGKTAEIPYQLVSPTVHTISPLEATFREHITIEGENFDEKITENEVYFGDVRAEIIHAENNKLIVTVPDDLNESKVKIKVIAQRQEVVFDEFFEMKTPIIYSYQDCIQTYQIIEIFGEYFNPVPQKNIVLLEGIEAEVLDVYPDKLYAMVPQGPFPRGKMDIVIKAAGYALKGIKDVCIEDTWLMVSNKIPFNFDNFPGAFVVKDKAYVLANSTGNPNKINMWEMNPVNYTWKQLEVPFDLNSYGSSTSNGEKAYVYTSNSNNEFWEFDGLSWTQKNAFIGPRRDGASMFAIGSNIYLGIGADIKGQQSIPFQDFYMFDPAVNLWKPIKQPLFGGRLRPASFVINGLAYVTDGAENLEDLTMMRYDPISDSWIYVAEQYFSRLHSVGFSFNGKGYTAIGSSFEGSGSPESHEFDPNTNKWSHGPPVGHKGRIKGFAFVLKGEPYIGGGVVDWGVINEGGEKDLLKWVNK